jgi:hypothetical protein
MRKVAGVTFIFVGLLLYVILFSVMVQYGLFIAMGVSLPAFYVVLFGCSLILRGGFKRAILWWTLFTTLTIVPWIAVLPINYQIISYIILATTLTSILMWYGRKLVFHSVNEKKEKDSTEKS